MEPSSWPAALPNTKTHTTLFVDAGKVRLYEALSAGSDSVLTCCKCPAGVGSKTGAYGEKRILGNL